MGPSFAEPKSRSSNSKYCFRQAKGTGPALRLVESFWALSQRELPVERALEQACINNGLEYFEAGLRDERLATIKALLSRFSLKLIAQGWATSAKEADQFIQRAAELQAVALNMHLGHAYMTTCEAADLVGAVHNQAAAYGIPLLLETHRGRLTQDLFRTADLLAHLQDTVITLDISHYIVAGETLGGSEERFRANIEPLLERTAVIHGRISNGQSIQVPTNDDFAFSDLLQSLWQQAMSIWLRDAPKDAVFLFEPEIGPPPYAYLTSSGKETFSREAESRQLAEIAHRAWAAALAVANSPVPT
jgi:hypothetical protein